MKEILNKSAAKTISLCLFKYEENVNKVHCVLYVQVECHSIKVIGK